MNVSRLFLAAAAASFVSTAATAGTLDDVKAKGKLLKKRSGQLQGADQEHEKLVVAEEHRVAILSKIGESDGRACTLEHLAGQLTFHKKSKNSQKILRALLSVLTEEGLVVKTGSTYTLPGMTSGPLPPKLIGNRDFMLGILISGEKTFVATSADGKHRLWVRAARWSPRTRRSSVWTSSRPSVRPATR